MRKHKTWRRSYQTDWDYLGEQLLSACQSGDIPLITDLLKTGANMNMICSSGRTPFGTAAQLGNVEILRVFLNHCKEKGKKGCEWRVKKMKQFEGTAKADEKSNVGDIVFFSKEPSTTSGENNVKVDENLNSQCQRMYCTCNDVGDTCLGKRCEDNKSVVSVMNKTKYDLACFNETLVRREAQFVTKNCTEGDLLSDDEVRTPDGMDDLQWDMEVEGSSDVPIQNDDPYSALYIWYAGILSQTSSLFEEKPPPEDINREDRFGCGALHYAALGGHVDAVRLLINAGCRVNQTDCQNTAPLHLAAAENRPSVVEALIKAGAFVDQKTADKISPLHVAASRGLLNNVKLLIKAGAHIDSLDYSDRTPLFKAVTREHEEVVSYLLSKGAKTNIEEIHGYTPLYEAVSNQNITIVEMLLKAGAKITHSHNLLHTAILSGHVEMVRLLVSAGCIINLRDERGNTPLALAAKTLQTKIVKLLLEKGAAVNARNDVTGDNALHEVIKNMRGNIREFEEMFYLFQKFNINLEGPSFAVYRALHLAIFHKEDAAAAMLIRHGLDVTNIPSCESSHEIADLFQLVLQRGNRLLTELFVYAGYNFRVVQIPQSTTHPLERWIIHLQANPMTLSDLCRVKVRRHFKSKIYEKVSALPIPIAVKSYLKLEDIC